MTDRSALVDASRSLSSSRRDSSVVSSAGLCTSSALSPFKAVSPGTKVEGVGMLRCGGGSIGRKLRRFAAFEVGVAGGARRLTAAGTVEVE